MSDQVLKELIIAKAWEDAEFKQQLIADPKGTIARIFGIDIPDGIDIETVTESSKKVYLVIPPTPYDVKQDDVIAAARWI
ncbi:hypothetical protein B1748_33255 [Paenibacillus sp. MY03]|uniref:NHLP leader peptide family RiPP precursor n=1 Tax=Paenibacillus sp. MY03 TaxID=302980 RepID=UPI000B3C1CDF|nr:NHLP leader peptide family RiPP precursor [Paenibacillus sp. MY03]OUS68649.1 hypothetical protein B1748_33255 [Paenibacillus sp. MY03]